MPRIRILLVVVALLASSYAVTQAQTLIFQQNKCEMGKVAELRAFVDSAFVPIAQELVNEGKLGAFSSAFHAWGDEWNVMYFYIAESIPAFLSAFGEAYARMSERYPESLPMFQDWCFEHKDSFYSLGRMTGPPQP